MCDSWANYGWRLEGNKMANNGVLQLNKADAHIESTLAPMVYWTRLTLR